jgi:SAM-dependent methyltransferase
MSDPPTLALYEGTAGSRLAQDDTRRAIHWVCGSVRGREVLDADCGEGIAAILLGREGSAVLGLDPDSEAIGRARGRLGKEEESVQQRVRFQVGEIHALPVKNAAYDTVLLGDLPSRLVDPTGALAEVRRVLRDDGQIVLTAASFEDDQDLNDPLNLTEMLDLLHPAFAVESMQLLGDRVGIAAVPGSGADLDAGVYRRALTIVESRLASVGYSESEGLRDQGPPVDPGNVEDHALVAALRERVAALEDRVRQAREESEIHEAALGEERSRLIRLQVQRDGAITERDRLQSVLAEREKTLGEAEERALATTTEAAELRATAQAVAEHRDRAIGEIEAARVGLDEATARAAELERASTEAEQRFAESERTRRETEQRAAELERASTEAEQRFAESERTRREAVRVALASLQGEVSVATAELATARQRLAAAESERDLRVQRELTLESEVKRLTGALNARGREVRERDSELHELRLTVRRQEGTVARLERTVEDQGSQVRTLAEIRAGRAYRMMRWLWRLNAAVHSPWPRKSLPSAPRDAGPVELPVPSKRAIESGGGPGSAESSVQERSPAPEAVVAPRPAPPKPARTPTTKQRFEALDVEADRRRFLAGTLEPRPRQTPLRVADLRVAGVVGTHLAAGLAEACELVTFRPDNWRYVLEAAPPHLLLVESTFVGNARSWQHRVAETNHPDVAGLAELVAACRDAGVPTVFWLTRDKSQAGPFLRSLRHFEQVFAADPEAADMLNAAVDDGVQVRHLPLAGTLRAADRVERDGTVFIGEWPARWTSAQRSRLAAHLDAALPHGLRILDPSDHDASRFPDRFAERVEPSHSRIHCLEALARAKAAIVIEAPDSALVPGVLYDAASVGAVIVTGPDPVLPEGFAEGVFVLEPTPKAATQLGALLADETRRLAVAERARVALAARHTYRHRVAEVAAAAGFGIASGG